MAALLIIVHSIVGIKVANKFILMRNKPSIEGASIITANIFMIVYVIYLFRI